MEQLYQGDPVRWNLAFFNYIDKLYVISELAAEGVSVGRNLLIDALRINREEHAFCVCVASNSDVNASTRCSESGALTTVRALSI